MSSESILPYLPKRLMFPSKGKTRKEKKNYTGEKKKEGRKEGSPGKLQT